jgi:hypothetical protein
MLIFVGLSVLALRKIVGAPGLSITDKTCDAIEGLLKRHFTSDAHAAADTVGRACEELLKSPWWP